MSTMSALRNHAHERLFFGASTDLNLLPVEIEKVWSDQLPGVEANYQASASLNGFTANGTGRGNKSYIFLGAAQSNNFDGKGHIKAKVKVSSPAELRNKILWRLAKKSGASYTPQNGSSNYDANGEIVTITIDSPAEATDEADHYHLVAGYDQDGNGQLSSSEGNVVPKFKWTHKNASGQSVSEDRDYEFKIVSASRYNSAKQSLLSDAWWGTLVTPQASRLLKAFANGAVPQGATSENTTIDRLEPGLDHPVGILFNASQPSAAGLPKAGPGASITAVFAPGSSMSRDVAESTTLNNWFSAQLGQYAQEVHNYFLAHPNEITYTMYVHFSTVNPQTNHDAGLGFDGDVDLYLALNRVSVELDAEIEVHRSLQINTMTITGSVLDLYDFNYDGNESAFVKPAALTQAGYNTLGNGGRVHKSRIELLNATVPIQYQFP
jgi:hypothetical protein